MGFGCSVEQRLIQPKNDIEEPNRTHKTPCGHMSKNTNSQLLRHFLFVKLVRQRTADTDREGWRQLLVCSVILPTLPWTLKSKLFLNWTKIDIYIQKHIYENNLCAKGSLSSKINVGCWDLKPFKTSGFAESGGKPKPKPHGADYPKPCADQALHGMADGGRPAVFQSEFTDCPFNSMLLMPSLWRRRVNFELPQKLQRLAIDLHISFASGVYDGICIFDIA